MNRSESFKPSVLFFTCANKKYEVFAILYPLFVFESNKTAFVEIGLEDLSGFLKKYTSLVNFYNEKYPGRILYREVNFFKNDFFRNKEIPSGSVRFLNIPHMKADYVYIGDVDILILEDIFSLHIKNIKKNNLDFSNIIRLNSEQLTGLHFMKYDLMYTSSYLEDLKKIDIFSNGDEEFLYKLLKFKANKFPKKSLQYRPQHGIHVSFFNRPPFSSLTTLDKNTNFPNWFDGINKEKDFAKLYLRKRYKGLIKEFMSKIDVNNIELRRLIQIIDSVCFFKVFQKKLIEF